MSRQLWMACGAGVICLLLAGQGQAGFLITTGSITLDQGGSGFVPVLIQSTSGPESLDFVGYQFQITTTSGRLLEFQDSPFPDPTFSDPTYVFFGDSANQSVMSGSGFASSTGEPNDTFIGGDFTADGTRVIIVETSAMLLVDLPVTAVTASRRRCIHDQPGSVGGRITDWARRQYGIQRRWYVCTLRQPDRHGNNHPNSARARWPDAHQPRRIGRSRSCLPASQPGGQDAAQSRGTTPLSLTRGNVSSRPVGSRIGSGTSPSSS